MMKLSPKLCWVFSMVFSVSLCAQKISRLVSPNGNIVFSIQLANKMLAYAVSFKGKPLIENSPLSLSFIEGGEFKNNLRIGSASTRETEEDYELVVGKTKKVRDRYKELSIPVEETISPFRQILIRIRAFDDGIAFRYEIPEQKNWTSFQLTEENSSFRLTGNPKVHTLFRINYTTSHEGVYSTVDWDDIRPDTLMDMPALFEFPNHCYLAITEADLIDYAGMYLTKHAAVLTSRLSPLPGQTEIKVKAQLPHHSPWRVLMISDRIGALIESNILTDLNEPCKIKDPSWIRPGKTTFPWWNGNVLPDTINAPGNNFVTAKYYIDFCARNGLEYHSVVEYGLHQWYMDDGVGFQPGPHSDVTTPVPGLDMAEICQYAKQKNVGVRVWVHWAALYPRLDSAFSIFEKWGLAGMMVDFMDRDDQLMVNIQEEILRKAAAHHLHIQFHGAYKPTGLSRTWPNELTREGTLNYEADKWTDDGISPDHDINMPFTRMLAGSTDYHLGGFRAVPPAQFRAQYTRPLMLGTRCHMLAMYVVLENYLGMVCDYPEAYEGQPGFEFIKEVPTVWDETKVVDAGVCQYITIARKNKADWFVGSITDHQPRDLIIPLDFLPEGAYTADIYSDAPDVNQNPNHLNKQTKTVVRNDSLTIHLASGGGAVIHLKKQ
jgi:alpha-glucosidase